MLCYQSLERLTEYVLKVKRLRTENVNMFSVLEENKSLRQQLETTTEKVSHDVLVEVPFIKICCFNDD
jgi:hypothetical protein